MSPDSQSSQPAAVASQERFLTSHDGLQIFYRDYPGPGDRPPLLCLHGLTRNSRDFEAFAERYAGRFRVIAMDFRGRGNSDRDPQPERYLPTTYAADVITLLDDLAIDRAIFVGTSLGGLVTMVLAAIQPQRIAAAILNDVGPDLEDRGLERIRGYAGKGVEFRDWTEAAAYVARINANLPASHGPDDWVRTAKRLCKEDGGRVVFDYDMAIADAFNAPADGQAFDMWPLYRQLARVPLLILRAEHSDLLSPATAATMRDAAPGATLVTVEGVGHAPELGEPTAVAAIDEFLRRFER